MTEIIHCYCKKLGKQAPWHLQPPQFYRVLGVLLEDGRLEMKNDGKSSTVSGGIVDLRCKRCGFQREIALDSRPLAVVG